MPSVPSPSPVLRKRSATRKVSCLLAASHCTQDDLQLVIPKHLEVTVTALYEQSTFISSYRSLFGNPWKTLLDKAYSLVEDYLKTIPELKIPADLNVLLAEFIDQSKKGIAISFYRDEQGIILGELYSAIARLLAPSGYKYEPFRTDLCKPADMAKLILDIDAAISQMPAPPQGELKHQVMATILGEEQYNKWLKLAT
jgi:hypothetical protein